MVMSASHQHSGTGPQNLRLLLQWDLQPMLGSEAKAMWLARFTVNMKATQINNELRLKKSTMKPKLYLHAKHLKMFSRLQSNTWVKNVYRGKYSKTK